MMARLLDIALMVVMEGASIVLFLGALLVLAAIIGGAA
jgi:hypothetical protein